MATSGLEAEELLEFLHRQAKIVGPMLTKEIVEAIEQNTEATNRVARALEDIIVHQWHSVR